MTIYGALLRQELNVLGTFPCIRIVHGDHLWEANWTMGAVQFPKTLFEVAIYGRLTD